MKNYLKILFLLVVLFAGYFLYSYNTSKTSDISFVPVVSTDKSLMGALTQSGFYKMTDAELTQLNSSQCPEGYEMKNSVVNSNVNMGFVFKAEDSDMNQNFTLLRDVSSAHQFSFLKFDYADYDKIEKRLISEINAGRKTFDQAQAELAGKGFYRNLSKYYFVITANDNTNFLRPFEPLIVIASKPFKYCGMTDEAINKVDKVYNPQGVDSGTFWNIVYLPEMNFDSDIFDKIYSSDLFKNQDVVTVADGAKIPKGVYRIKFKDSLTIPASSVPIVSSFEFTSCDDVTISEPFDLAQALSNSPTLKGLSEADILLLKTEKKEDFIEQCKAYVRDKLRIGLILNNGLIRLDVVSLSAFAKSLYGNESFGVLNQVFSEVPDQDLKFMFANTTFSVNQILSNDSLEVDQKVKFLYLANGFNAQNLQDVYDFLKNNDPLFFTSGKFAFLLKHAKNREEIDANTAGQFTSLFETHLGSFNQQIFSITCEDILPPQELNDFDDAIRWDLSRAGLEADRELFASPQNKTSIIESCSEYTFNYISDGNFFVEKDRSLDLNMVALSAIVSDLYIHDYQNVLSAIYARAFDAFRPEPLDQQRFIDVDFGEG